MAVVDTGEAVARQVERVWHAGGFQSSGKGERFWTSGAEDRLRHALSVLWVEGTQAAVLP